MMQKYEAEMRVSEIISARKNLKKQVHIFSANQVMELLDQVQESDWKTRFRVTLEEIS